MNCMLTYMSPARDVKIRRLDKPSHIKPLLSMIAILVVLFAVGIAIINIVLNYVLPTKTTTTHALVGGVYYELSIDKGYYKAGEPIKLKLIVKNITKKTVVLNFPTTQRYDFIVKRDINFIFFHFPIYVWESSYHIIPKPIPNSIVLHPGQTIAFEDVWNQKDAHGVQVPAGRYIISAYLATSGARPILELPTNMQKH
jgi:hypothetical protein